jgi:pentatricopeptide repeat protein
MNSLESINAATASNQTPPTTFEGTEKPFDKKEGNENPQFSEVQVETFNSFEEILQSDEPASLLSQDLSMKTTNEFINWTLSVKKNHLSVKLIDILLSTTHSLPLDSSFFDLATKTYNLSRLPDEA